MKWNYLECDWLFHSAGSSWQGKENPPPIGNRIWFPRGAVLGPVHFNIVLVLSGRRTLASANNTPVMARSRCLFQIRFQELFSVSTQLDQVFLLLEKR